MHVHKEGSSLPAGNACSTGADIPEKDFGLTFIGGVCSLAGGMVFE